MAAAVAGGMLPLKARWSQIQVHWELLSRKLACVMN